ncbi:MAG: BON domain-containing protein [Isosphaeraceae bacterium]
MMTKRQLGMTSAVLGAILVGGTLAAQQPPPPPGSGTGERVGAKVDSAVQSIKRGARDLAENIREGFARTKESVHHMGVESRVYGRLHWDKALTNAEIEVNAKNDGIVILRGAVPDLTAKAKAVALTRDTVGVISVEDLLTIGPVHETTTTTTTETIRDGKTIRQKTQQKTATPRP